MCGRTTHLYSWQQVAEYFRMEWAEPLADLKPRYNVAPGQRAPVVRDAEDGEGRRLGWLRWGLVPSWARDERIGYRTINARAETVASKPSFRSAFRRRRCLVPVSGFYEWRKVGKGKQPHYVRPREGAILALAGLWERWDKGADGPLETFTIVTTGANATLAPLHDRMPVIVAPDDFDLWLDRGVEDAALLSSLMRPARDDLLEAHPVGTRVNRVQHDDAACIERPEAPPDPSG